jgi:hypothetical protein
MHFMHDSAGTGFLKKVLQRWDGKAGGTSRAVSHLMMMREGLQLFGGI